MARGRNSKGRFTKGSSKVSIVKSRSRGGPLVVRETKIQVPRRRRGRGGGGASTSNRVRGGVFIVAAGLGYVEKNYASMFDKVPAVKGSRYLTVAAVGHFLIKPRPGSWLDHGVTAAAAIAGREIGQAGIIGDDDGAEWR